MLSNKLNKESSLGVDDGRNCGVLKAQGNDQVTGSADVSAVSCSVPASGARFSKRNNKGQVPPSVKCVSSSSESEALCGEVQSQSPSVYQGRFVKTNSDHLEELSSRDGKASALCYTSPSFPPVGAGVASPPSLSSPKTHYPPNSFTNVSPFGRSLNPSLAPSLSSSSSSFSSSSTPKPEGKSRKRKNKDQSRGHSKKNRVNEGFKEAFFQAKAQIDVMKHEQSKLPAPITNFSVPSGHPLHPILFPFFDYYKKWIQQDFFIDVEGDGLWFNHWQKEGVLPRYIWEDGRRDVPSDCASFFCGSAHDPSSFRHMRYWIGPTFYKHSESMLVGLWDQQFLFYDCNDAKTIFNVYAMEPIVQTADITLYEVLHKDLLKDNDKGRYFSPKVAKPVRWVFSLASRNPHDFLSSLIEEPSDFDLVYDLLAARTSFGRAVPHMTQSMWQKVCKANSSLIWAQGSLFCPLSLERGMMRRMLEASADTHKHHVFAGDYSQDSFYNFSSSLPNRFVSLFGGSWRQACRVFDEHRVVERVTEMVGELKTKFESTFSSSETDQEDPPPDPDQDGAYEVRGSEREKLDDYLQGGSDPFDPPLDIEIPIIADTSFGPLTRDLVKGVRAACETFSRLKVGVPFVELPLINLEGAIPVAMAWEADPASFEEMHLNAAVLKDECFYNPHFSIYGCPAHEFVESDGAIYERRQFLELANTKLSSNNPNLNTSRKWTQKLFQDLELEEQYNLGLYKLYNFDWPIYQAADTKAMSAITAVLRLADSAPFQPTTNQVTVQLPVLFDPFSDATVCLYDFLIVIAQIGLPWASDPKISVQVLSDEAATVDSYPDSMTKDMKPSSKNRRKDQLRELRDGVERDSQRVFRKTDERLLSAKPRLIYDCLGSQFWNLRTTLVFLQHALASQMFWTIIVGDLTLDFSYGGCMDPLKKGHWRRSVNERMSSCRTRDYVALLVGGDDILAVCSHSGVITELEIDVSKCDKSQTSVSYLVACSFILTFFDSLPEHFHIMRENMETKTEYFHGFTDLHTGTPETTCFNTITVGWSLALSFVFNVSPTKFMEIMGYSIKCSSLEPGGGTFHKGFWNTEWNWIPLPSRICKFGSMAYESRDKYMTIRELEDHIAGVSLGWRSMDLDPIFGIFVDACSSHVRYQNTPLIEQSDLWKKELWKGWNWERMGRNVSIDTVAPFYTMRYKIDVQLLCQLFSFLKSNVTCDPAHISHPALTMIYYRDYRCDTSDEYDAWLRLSSCVDLD